MKKSSIFSNISFFSWKSVFFRYLISLLLIILIVFIPFFLIIRQYSQYVYSRDLAAKSAENTLKSKVIFDLLNSSYFSNYDVLANAPTVTNVLKSESDTAPETSLQQIQSILQSMKYTDASIENLFIYGVKNHLYISTDGASTISDSRQISWLATYRSTKLPFMMFPRKIDSDTFNYIFTVREIYDSDGSTIGVFCVQTRYDDFQKLARQSFVNDDRKVYIVSDLGLILYSNDYSRINTLMFEDPDIYSAYIKAKDSTVSVLTLGDDVISIARSAQSNLILMEYNSIPQTDQWNLFLLNGSAVVLLIAVLSALFIALSHYRSVASVLKAIQQADDPEQIKVYPQMNSEFFYIANSIISNTQKSQELSQELVSKIHQLRHAQISELQAQINPHFVFNTLQMINLSILRETHRDTPATTAISLFSKLMRATYDSNQIVVSVEEELKNLKTFVEIQSIRYSGHLNASYHIDPACSKYRTLKLMLQPFVENCMLHGFNSDSPNRSLTVSCQLKNGYLVFTISDNGIGIPPEHLQKIRDNLKSAGIRGRHIGITNVQQRLTLLFENQANVHVDSTPGQGTRVTIIHPAVEHHPLENIDQVVG